MLTVKPQLGTIEWVRALVKGDPALKLIPQQWLSLLPAAFIIIMLPLDT